MTFRLKAFLSGLALGGGTIVAANVATAIPFGDPIRLGDGWDFLLGMLVVALPFLVLALLAERSLILWVSAVATTFLLWGYYVVEAVHYRSEGSSVLAHMGFDVLLFLYPLLLAPILAGLSLARKYLARSRERKRGPQ